MSTASKLEVYNAVDRSLKSLSLRYDGDAEKARFRFAIDTVSLRIECAEGTVLIYATSPHGVTTASRPAVNKMLNDINWRSAIGNWEMDPSDGEVRYKADFGFEQIPARLSDQLWHYLTLATEMDRKYRPRIMALSASSSPSPSGSSGGSAAAAAAAPSSSSSTPVVGTQVNSLFHHHQLTYGPSTASNQRCNICTNTGATDFYSCRTPGCDFYLCRECYARESGYSGNVAPVTPAAAAARPASSGPQTLRPDLPASSPGDTDLHRAARAGNRDQVAQLLAQPGARADVENDSGITPLVCAAVQGHTEVCRLLVDRGANVNHETKNQDTALSMAVWKQKPETAMFLVNRGANPNHVDKFGDSPLLDACGFGLTDLVRLMIALGANTRIVNKKGETCLTRALANGHVAVAQLL